MKTQILKKAGCSALVSFLPMFMLFIFGPSEIFFANATEFEFVYGEFIFYLAAAAVGITIVLTLILTLLPGRMYTAVAGLLLGASAAAYVQVMFLNKNLDLLGLNPDGYIVEASKKVTNGIIWGVIIVLFLVLSLFKSKIFDKIAAYGASFLLVIQVIALVSLLFTAKGTCFKREEGAWYLSGKDQFRVSSKENVIVLVLDYFSNEYVAPIEAAYPGAFDCLHDFTYYDNDDCTVYGTYPSLLHMVTGYELDPGAAVNDWVRNAWENENTVSFYNMLHKKNYQAYVYTPQDEMLAGLNDIEIMSGKLDNACNFTIDLSVDTDRLLPALAKMSCYRAAPETLKSRFYTNVSDYTGVVALANDGEIHNNYDFLDKLEEKGLELDDSHNYLSIHHLAGAHEYTTDENGDAAESTTLEQTGKGCMVLVEKYLEELKRLGVYDSATIIVTSDHGSPQNPQVIFYMKQPEEKHDTMAVSNAPISHNEFFPTIAEAVVSEKGSFGTTIFDIPADTPRERTFWLREYNEAYPSVSCYTGDKEGSENVYCGFTYTGDYQALKQKLEENAPEIVPEADSFY